MRVRTSCLRAVKRIAKSYDVAVSSAAERRTDRAGRDRRPTQSDVARLAGVSVATVSYVASGRGNRKSPATAETAARVRAAMAELDYVPARAGRVLARARTDLIAVCTYSLLTPKAAELITTVEDTAAAHDLGTVVLRHGSDGALQRVEAQLLDGLADAAVVLGDGFGAERLARVARRIPILAIGESYRPDGFDVVTQAESQAMAEAADHLIGLGVRRPVFLGAADSARRAEFGRRFSERGLPAPGLLDHDDNHFAPFFDSRPAAFQLLDQQPGERPDAVLAHSDRAAISTLWAALQLGIAVPDELRIIGVGNIADGRTVSPALTTVGVDAAEFSGPVRSLLERIDGPAGAGREFCLPWRLILRETA